MKNLSAKPNGIQHNWQSHSDLCRPWASVFTQARPKLALILAMGALACPWAGAETRGGHLDWVFYDDLPGTERARISAQCPGSFVDPWTDTGLADDELRVSAGQQGGDLNGTLRVQDQVVITQAVIRLYGEEAAYNTQTGRVSLPLGGLIRQPDLAILTERAQAETEQDQFQLYDARYALHMANLHGQADSVVRDEHVYRFERTWMTRCAPGKLGWSVHARTLQINTDTDFATAYHARLHVGPVPIAYTPYLRLNLNQQRSSGFLVPSTTYYTEYEQYRISTPYYWAIAPNLDSTTTADWMLGGATEDQAPQVAHLWQKWRYLNRRFRGELVVGTYTGWNDPNVDDAMWGLDASLRSRGSDLEWTLDYRNSNSDRYYSEFMGEEYATTAINRLTLGYETWTQTRLDAQVEQQTIFAESAKTGDLVYVQQPGVHVRQPLNLPSDWRLQGIADWERRYKAQPDYLEMELTPSVHDPLEAYRLRHRLILSRADSFGPWTFTQQYTGDHTHYTMPTFEDHPREGYHRLLWDTRHRLSYRIGLKQGQTLTPFVQYEFRPLDEEQTELPLMNTSVDRLRDRDRLTLGTRYEVARNDWRLTSDLQQTVDITKELLADTAIRDDDWTNPQAGPITWNNRILSGDRHSLGALFVWRAERPTAEPDLSFYGENYELRRFRLDYTMSSGRSGLSLNSDWRLDYENDNANPMQTLQFAAVVPITQVFGVFGYTQWEALNTEDDIELQETVIGLEYDGCCWHVQLAGQRLVNAELEESSASPMFDTIQLNFNLKGLGSVGGRNSLAQLVRDHIPAFGGQLFDTR